MLDVVSGAFMGYTVTGVVTQIIKACRTLRPAAARGRTHIC